MKGFESWDSFGFDADLITQDHSRPSYSDTPKFNFPLLWSANTREIIELVEEQLAPQGLHFRYQSISASTFDLLNYCETSLPALEFNTINNYPASSNRIFSFLRHTNPIPKLRFEGVNMTRGDMVKLAQTPWISGLDTLSISNCGITNAIINPLVTSFRRGDFSLRNLDLSHNKITHSFDLSDLGHLEWLELRGNILRPGVKEEIIAQLRTRGPRCMTDLERTEQFGNIEDGRKPKRRFLF